MTQKYFQDFDCATLNATKVPNIRLHL